MVRRSRALWLWVGCCAVAGCDGRWTETTVENQGHLCFEDQGDVIEVTVTASACLSSSCSRRLGGQCQATRDGSTIEVTSEIHWEERGGECTSDCGAASVTCLLVLPPDGEYSVVHGGETTTLTVPEVTICAEL